MLEPNVHSDWYTGIRMEQCYDCGYRWEFKRAVDNPYNLTKNCPRCNNIPLFWWKK